MCAHIVSFSCETLLLANFHSYVLYMRNRKLCRNNDEMQSILCHNIDVKLLWLWWYPQNIAYRCIRRNTNVCQWIEHKGKSDEVKWYTSAQAWKREGGDEQRWKQMKRSRQRCGVSNTPEYQTKCEKTFCGLKFVSLLRYKLMFGAFVLAIFTCDGIFVISHTTIVSHFWRWTNFL